MLTTRLSLLVRIRDPRDADAWSQFIDIYAPMIYRYGRRAGLQESDLADLTQEVLKEVSQSIQRFDYDSKRGRFRGWMKTVIHHTHCQLGRRASRQPTGSGDTQFLQRLQNEPGDSDARFWDTAYTQRLFELAAEQIEPTVKPSTWEAFTATALHNEPPEDVARRLDMNIGSVYVAKNRMLSRLQSCLQELDG